jgi:WD40 repeat protein
VTAVAFSPDGRILASGTFDGGLTLWDTSTGLPFAPPFKIHERPLTSLSFGPDGRSLASGSADAPLVLWSLEVKSWIEYACTTAGRNLTELEWRQHLGDRPYAETCPRQIAEHSSEREGAGPARSQW